MERHMRKKLKRTGLAAVALASLLLFVVMASASAADPSNESLAYEYLDSVMDQYNYSFDIFTDANSGGNHYAASGWYGDWGDLGFDMYETADTHGGTSSIRVDYSAEALQGNNWAGIYWQDPANNWGEADGGFDLRGATQLSFWAQGATGGEWIDFRTGGLNRAPFNDPAKPYKDSFGPIGTGNIQLTNEWQKYAIPLDRDYFDVYRDQHLAWWPSGWMGDMSALSVNDSLTRDTHAGRAAMKIDYYPSVSGWSGIYWQNPANNWGDSPGGFDLSGFQELSFYAKGAAGNEKVEFFTMGLGRNSATGVPNKPYYDSSAKVSIGTVTLTDSWQKYTIILSGRDLSRVIGAFGFVATSSNNPSGASFLLDDIRFSRPMSQSQLQKVLGGFAVVAEKAANPSGASFYLDDIQFDKPRADALRFLNSFEILDPWSERALAGTGFTYDNTLAMLAYISRGTPGGLVRARIIGDTLTYAQDHDRYFTDGRLRNAYRPGDITQDVTGDALIPGSWNQETNTWEEEATAPGTSTGNVAWAMLALLAYDEETEGSRYSSAVERIGDWVETEMRDTEGAGGYQGGYRAVSGDSGVLKDTWKSTEHNLDLFVVFSRLYRVTGDHKWKERAAHARHFVEAMWDADTGHFWTGTTEDGVGINESNVPLDAQTWAVLANPSIEEYRRGLTWAETYSLNDCGEFTGFDFNDDRDGVWFEGTAQAALAFAVSGHAAKADYYVGELREAQISAENSNGRGIVAACRDGVTTGFDWLYNARLHIGATAWYLFAEQGFNPYWPTTVTPDTVLTTNPVLAGVNQWFTSQPEVSLDAGDLATTYYRWDTGPSGLWNEYGGPFSYSGEDGVHKLSYRSVDISGGREAVKTREIKVDGTPPEPAFGVGAPKAGKYLRSLALFTATANDLTSGISRLSLFEGGSVRATDYTSPYLLLLNTKLMSNGPHTILLKAFDNAGNQTTVTRDYKVDNYRPKTSVKGSAKKAVLAERGEYAKLSYKVTDPYTDAARVTIKVKTLKGKLKKTIKVGWKKTGSFKIHKYKVTLRRGKYRYYVYATDRAGNSQGNVAKKALTVW